MANLSEHFNAYIACCTAEDAAWAAWQNAASVRMIGSTAADHVAVVALQNAAVAAHHARVASWDAYVHAPWPRKGEG